MTTRRGTQHTKRRRPGRAGERGEATCYAAAACRDDVEIAMQQAHDKVITMSAGHRRSGVRFHWWPADRAHEAFETLGDPTAMERYRPYVDFLNEHPDGYLIAATVTSTRMQSKG